MISNGILSQEVVRVGNNLPKEEKKKKPDSAFLSNFVGVRDDDGFKEDENGGLTFLYSFGATLNVQNPAFGFLTSGPVSYPSNRPIAAAFIHPQSKGKLVVMGSLEMFTDEYFDKEENGKLLVSLITTISICIVE